MIDREGRAREIMRRAHDDGRWQDGVQEVLDLVSDVASEVDAAAYQRGRLDEHRSPNLSLCFHAPAPQPDGHP